MIFVGYELGSNAYHCFDLVNSKVVISRDVVFEENEKWTWSTNGENSHSLTFLPNFLSDQAHEDQSQPLGEEEEASAEVTSSSNASSDMHSPRYWSLTDLYSETSPITQDEEVHLLSGEEPLSYTEAASEEVWMRAMREEMLSIDRNDTWELENKLVIYHSKKFKFNK